MRIESAMFCSLLLLVGCRETPAAEADAGTKQAASPAPTAVSAPAPAPETIAAAPSPSLSPSLEESNFRIEFSAPESAKVGEAFAVHLKLSALSGYKVNQDYPIKLVLEGENLTFDPPVLRKEQLKLETKSAELTGKVTPKSAGSLAIVGKLSFSVCTEERCLIEKRDVMVKVSAS
jgi:hypothetical protein